MFQQIFDQITSHETVIIHRHMKPDPDALGSQMGLKAILEHNFPEKRILATGYDEPSLAWLALMDQVTDQDYQGALVIVTDTANQPRIDDKRYNLGNCLIKIDHHPNEDVYGDIVYVDTSASSASEIVTDFAQTTGLSLNDRAAYLLYAGIVGDTGRFLYPATTSKTLALASYLRTFDFDFASLARQMDTFSLKIAKLQSYVFEHLEISPSGAARVFLSQEVLRRYEVTDAESSAIVGSPGKIDTVQAWGIFVQQPDGHYRVRLRSKKAIINTIAMRHDGGGHPLASGANSYSDAENEHIFQELQEAVLTVEK